MNSIAAGKKIRVSKAFWLILSVAVAVVLVQSLASCMDSTDAMTTRINFTKARISIIENALYKFKNDVGRFPYTEEGLSALLWFPADIADWNGPYFNRDQPPMDGWNRQFIYNYPPVLGEKDFDLYSLGPNGVDENGEGDDIVNW